MKVAIISFCLIGAVFANPILYNVILEQNGHETNTTLSVSSSQSSESDTSELQSSEENTSHQSSKSESIESTSEDTTSEEIDSQSLEEGTDSHGETRDNSLGSEENVRRPTLQHGWIHVYANVIKALSAEDNSSTEIPSQTEHLENTPSQKPPSHNSSIISLGRAGNMPAQSNNTQTLVESQTKDSGETSDSADSSDSADVTNTTKSSESSSSESNDTSETSEDTSESSESNASESSESNASESSESNASDSTELNQIKSKDCLEGGDSTACESEEYFFQGIGDDGHHPADHLMVPDDDHRELILRR